MNFRPRKEHELALLTDDELIAYIVAARDAGFADEARVAMGILAFRRLGDVRRRVAIKVPKADVDDVAMEVMASALKAAFAGECMGEFVSLLHTITDRRVADFHRSRKPQDDPLPEENAGDEDVWGRTLATDDFTVEIDLRAVADQALGELSSPHRAVVEHYVFRRETAREAAEAVNMSCGEELDRPMTEDNVHQIAKRFRDRMRELLDEARGSEDT